MQTKKEEKAVNRNIMNLWIMKLLITILLIHTFNISYLKTDKLV